MEDSQIIEEISSLNQDNVAQFLQEAHILLAQRYDDEEDEQCIEGSQYLLQNYPVSPLLRIKLYALISMASEDWHDAEHYRKDAEFLFATLVNELPVGTKVHVDIINLRSELNTLAAYQLENEPLEDREEEPSEPLPKRLLVPSLETVAGRGNTQEELQRIQYLIEECEDTDEFFYDNDLAAYQEALQQILDRGGVPPLLALRSHILTSSAATHQTWAEEHRKMAEDIWHKQQTERGSQMSPDIQSFMQATRRELDLLLKDHEDTAAAAKAEVVSQTGDTSGDAPELMTLPHHPKLQPDAAEFVPGASASNTQNSQEQEPDQANKRSLDNDGADEAGVKRPKQELTVTEQPPVHDEEEARLERQKQQSPPVKQPPPKSTVATGTLSLDKELPPLPTNFAEEAAVQRFKPESPSAKQSLTKIFPSANKSSKTKEPLASAVSPFKGKDLLQNTPADPKQGWISKVTRALSPTKATAAKTILNPASNTSTHSLATPRASRLNFGFGNSSTTSLASTYTPSVRGRTVRGVQPSTQPRASAAELFSTEDRNLETPTISRASNIPIRVAGGTVRGPTRPQPSVPGAGDAQPAGNTIKKKNNNEEPPKMRYDERDPFSPKP
ncbi:hypothetical protein KCU78_g2037, partial [Aureobasidium melanogenum]